MQRRRNVATAVSHNDDDDYDGGAQKGPHNASKAAPWTPASIAGAFLAFLFLGPVTLLVMLTILGYFEAPYHWLFRFLFYLSGYH